MSTRLQWRTLNTTKQDPEVLDSHGYALFDFLTDVNLLWIDRVRDGWRVEQRGPHRKLSWGSSMWYEIARLPTLEEAKRYAETLARMEAA